MQTHTHTNTCTRAQTHTHTPADHWYRRQYRKRRRRIQVGESSVGWDSSPTDLPAASVASQRQSPEAEALSASAAAVAAAGSAAAPRAAAAAALDLAHAVHAVAAANSAATAAVAPRGTLVRVCWKSAPLPRSSVLLLVPPPLLSWHHLHQLILTPALSFDFGKRESDEVCVPSCLRHALVPVTCRTSERKKSFTRQRIEMFLFGILHVSAAFSLS